jgi:hypothetical protein|tara:strand:+ start:1451 stop:1795 length:345 start_codon:yes stop_codon:yes gene_type:complete
LLNKKEIIERLIYEDILKSKSTPPTFFPKQMKMLNTLCERYSQEFMSVVTFDRKFDSLEVLISPLSKKILDKKFRAFNFKVDLSKYPIYNIGDKEGEDIILKKQNKTVKDFLDE